MADKNLNINIKVDSKQVDDASKKVVVLDGQTKQLSKDVKIKYDISGKPIEVITNSTQNLRTQLRALQAEFRRTNEGTAEFTLLANKINDTQDQLERVNQKSKDVFATMSLIPGPVGDFAGKVNGVLSAVKLLSGFKLSDIGNQFKELGKDIKEIIGNVTGLNRLWETSPKGFKPSSTSTTTTTPSGGGTNVAQAAVAGGVISASATNAATAATNAYNASLQQAEILTVKRSVSDLAYRSSIRDIDIAISKLTRTQVANGTITAEQAIAINRLSTAEQFAILQKEGLATANMQLAGTETTEMSTKILETEATAAATVATEANILAQRQARIAMAEAGVMSRVLAAGMRGLGLGEYYAATAALTLESVLDALGIGLIIAAVGYAIEKFIDWGKTMGWWGEQTKVATDYTKQYTEAIEKNSSALDRNLQDLEFNSKKKQLIAKATADTTKSLNEQITKIETDAFAGQQKLYSDQIAYLQGLRAKAAKDTKLDAEKKHEVLTNIDKQITTAAKNYVDARNNIELKGMERSAEIGDQRRKDSEEASKMLLELQQNNAVQTLKTEREREDKDLQIQAEAESKRVDALLISTKRKEELKLQILVKYGAKLVQMNEKRVTEDLAKMKEASDKEAQALKDYQKRKQEILDAASADEFAKAKAQRLTKYNDDLAALEADKNFIKASEDEKSKLRLALLTALNMDIKKINDDQAKKEKEERLKKLDDELKFLQIKGEGLNQRSLEYFDNLQKMNQLEMEREIAALEQTENYEKQKAAIQEKYAKQAAEIDKKKWLQFAQNISDGLEAAKGVADAMLAINDANMTDELENAKKTAKSKEELAAKEDKIKEKYFYKNKAAQKAQAYINTFQAAVSAYAAMAAIPVVGPVLGAIAAAAAIVAGLANVRKIDAQTYQSSTEGGGGSAPASNQLGRNYGDGGMIEGPRHSNGGVPITAEGGEAVMTRGAVTMFAPMLSAMNQMGGGTSFSKGAVGASRFDNPKLSDKSKEQSPVILKTYVVSKDMQSEIEKQTRLKDLSTL